MRRANGTGQIIKLSGNRRRPFAVRMDDGVAETAPNHFSQKVKYLGYFEKRKDAQLFLEQYNSGYNPKKPVKISKVPTFADVYDRYIDFRQRLKKGMSDSLIASYNAAYKNMAPLHSRKFVSIKADDLQKVISSKSYLSQSSVNNMIIVLHGMYKIALRDELVERDYSRLVTCEWTDAKETKHKPFTEEEIATLWEARAVYPLILIYTGMRGSEFLNLDRDKIDFSAHYMIGGIKTEAGKNRIIPISDKVEEFIRDDISSSSPVIGCGKPLYHFKRNLFQPEMERLGMDHKPHDCRHTCATLMERAGIPLLHRKLILGHSSRDITEGVYTHVSPSALVDDINKI